MQMTETVAAATNKGIVMMPESGRTNAWSRRISAMDKTVVAERLREFGLSTPRTLTGPAFDARQIVEVLGLPVVRKPRTGSSGDGVSIIRSLVELEIQIAEEQNSDDYFFERHVEGSALQFGGVFSGDENDTVVTYETLQRRCTFAPASRIRIIEDEGIAETGRRVVAALGITGIMNVNVIRDGDGRDWIHDVNPRVFGSFMAFRPRGTDLLQSYADWVIRSAQPEVVWPKLSVGSRRFGDTGISLTTGIDGGPPAKLPGCAKKGSSFLVFPAAFRDKSDDHNPLRSMWRYFRSALPYVRWVGLRYITYETALQLQFEWKRLRNRRGYRAAGVQAEPELTLPHPLSR